MSNISKEQLFSLNNPEDFLIYIIKNATELVGNDTIDNVNEFVPIQDYAGEQGGEYGGIGYMGAISMSADDLLCIAISTMPTSEFNLEAMKKVYQAVEEAIQKH